MAVSRARRILFICSQNKLRSPTAEQVFAELEGVETASAGLNHDADVPVSPELLSWADTICVMEREQRNRLAQRFGPHLAGRRVVCLDIPDRYTYMEPALIAMLRQRRARILGL